MAEVDGIIIQTLRNLGCEIPEDIPSVRDFREEVIVQAVALCLRAINSNIDVPGRLSASMATKYRQASTLANACKALGYNGDIGYEAFMYGGENEIRKLLLFLLDKIPKEDRTGVGVETLPYGNVFARDIAQMITKEMQRPWLPPALWSFAVSTSPSRFPSVPALNNPFRSQRIVVGSAASPDTPASQNEDPDITHQVDDVSGPQQFLGSVIEFNSLKLATATSFHSADVSRSISSNRHLTEKTKNSIATDLMSVPSSLIRASAGGRQKPALPPRKPKPGVSTASTDMSGPEESVAVGAGPEDAVEEKELTEEERAAAIKLQLEGTTESVRNLVSQIESISQSVAKTETAITEGKDFLKGLEASTSIKRQVAQSAASSSGQISTVAVQKDIEELAENLQSMEDEWEGAKVKLSTQTAQLRQQSLANENSLERVKEEIQQTKHTVSALQSSLSERDDHIHILRRAYEQMSVNPTTSRTAYTKRILEILANIKKQRVEIDKIIKDTRILQKDINQLSGRLERAFVETEELMFSGAKSDEFIRRAYKSVAAFHETCAGLINTVEATGLVMREMKDLEDQILKIEIRKFFELNDQALLAFRSENSGSSCGCLELVESCECLAKRSPRRYLELGEMMLVDAESKRDKEANFQRIREDLAEVKKENEALGAGSS